MSFEDLESEAIKQIQSLQKGSTQKGISAVFTMCNEKSKLIHAYFAQSPKTPTGLLKNTFYKKNRKI